MQIISFYFKRKNYEIYKIETAQLHADSMIFHCEITCLDCGLIWNSVNRLNNEKLRNDSSKDASWKKTKINMKPISKLL